jgi:hypothetical protein
LRQPYLAGGATIPLHPTKVLTQCKAVLKGRGF